jgi:DNA polymerase-3 subunit delta'
LRARQGEEIVRLQEEAERRGEKVIPARKALDDRHRRELRRARTDELRAGLDVLLSVYRERLGSPQASSQRLRVTLEAMSAIDEAATRLARNVNETMLLQWLLLRLDT